MGWRFLHGTGWTRGNPFSLSAAPDGRSLRITAKDLGDGSRRLARIPRGTRVLFEGPYGRLTEEVRSSPKVTMIASGIGITPLRALLDRRVGDTSRRPGRLPLRSAQPGAGVLAAEQLGSRVRP